jgi:penicillin amidase
MIDTVYYTLHGPVTYDPSFPDPAKSGKLLACTWMAHRGTNELLSVYLLNRATDYNAFTAAIQHFECPAQNFAYADKAGNIAMWGQGRYINKWRGQGKYVMEGKDSLTLWGGDIPMEENPHVLNPPQGYVASANQSVTDSTYPYWYNGDFVEWRSWEINTILDSTARFVLPYPSLKVLDVTRNSFRTIIGNQAIQNNTYSLLIEELASQIGRLLSQVDKEKSLAYTTPNELTVGQMEGSPMSLSVNNIGGTFMQSLWANLLKDIWQDDFTRPGSRYPSTERTVQLLLTDSTSTYYDDKRTQQIESLRDIVQRAFKETTDSLDKLKHTTGLEWYKVKNTCITHLAKIPAFSYDTLKVGGWSNTINANTHDHGPSWRMIVEMDDSIQAYAIYPGGQSGNPGSPHYGDFIDQWATGKYNPLRFLTSTTTTNPFKYTWTLTP